jgi:hypothetical protein
VPVPPAFPQPSSRRNWKPLVLAVIVLVVLGLICCLAVGGFWIYPKFVKTTPTPKSTSTETAGPTSTITSTSTITPTSSQQSVEFQGVSFSCDPSLATGVTPEVVPAYTDPEAPSWDLHPEFRQFTFQDYHHTSNQRIYPQLSVYPTDAYTSVSAEAGKQISSLRDFLEAKPTSLGYNQDVPFLPTWNSAQAIAAGLSYLDFQNGSGVRFLTQFCQDVCPIENAFLFYTFQGLTHDERFYVSLRLPVSHPLLVGEENHTIDDEFIANYPNYILDLQDKLNAQPASGFTPDLSLLDAVILSLSVE